MSERDDLTFRSQAKILRGLGFGFFEGVEHPAPAARAAASPDSAAGRDPAPDESRTPLSLEERLERLSALHAEVGACTACRLSNSRTNVVPGEGNPMAGLMFVGEGPGGTEDKLGRPFVGPAGELLDKIINAMGFERQEVFIANIVKCRPPGNRQPETDEMDTCLPYLERQIAIIQPKVIVTLGKTALAGLLPGYRRQPMSAVRGQWLEYDGISVMPTFHPAYLLRNPAGKRAVWEDMQKVMAEFGKTA